jgi:hypothetical protein
MGLPLRHYGNTKGYEWDKTHRLFAFGQLFWRVAQLGADATRV